MNRLLLCALLSSVAGCTPTPAPEADPSAQVGLQSDAELAPCDGRQIDDEGRAIHEVTLPPSIAPEPTEATFELHSCGGAPLVVSGASWAQGDPEGLSVLGLDAPVELAPGESSEVTVRFLVPWNGDATLTLLVRTNDEAVPVAPVDVHVQGHAPRLEVSTAEVGFAPLTVGCVDTRPLVLENRGRAPLDITELVIDNPSTLGEFEVEFSGPETIAPGDEAVVGVTYVPQDASEDVASLVVRSTDPTVPEMEVRLQGSGLEPVPFEEETTIGSPVQVDILWVLDTRASMTGHLTAIAAAAEEMTDTLDAAGVDYQIGVIVGDQGDGGVIAPFPYISGATIDPATALTLALQPATGSSNQTLFDSALDALSGSFAPGSENGTFLRPDSVLEVIFVSNAQEQSTDLVGVGSRILRLLLPEPSSLPPDVRRFGHLGGPHGMHRRCWRLRSCGAGLRGREYLIRWPVCVHLRPRLRNDHERSRRAR